MEQLRIASTKPAVEVWEECEACNGTGRQLESFRYSGEAYGGYVETCCDDCDGDGGWFAEPMCPFCEVPLTSGICQGCNEYVLTAHGVVPLADGWAGVRL